MRSQFSGYFDPSEAELDALWKDGVIALDTNVLLGLYRMPEASRKEIFELLTQVKQRLWVPYHVLVEFHRNRLEAMRTEFAASKQLGKDVKNAYETFKAVVNHKGVQERACWPEISATLNQLNEKAEELFKVTKTESEHYVSPNKKDSVLAFVEELLDGRTGRRPERQDVVTAAEVAAKERYSVKMGPGYLDQEKAGDFYMFDGMTYERQYGDYMVWRELLDHSTSNKITRLLLVTSDVKPDWWLDSQSISGKRPQPELVMEMRREAGVQCFWMYTLSDFIQNAKHHLQAHITPKAIADAKQAEVMHHARSYKLFPLKPKPKPKPGLVSADDIGSLISQFADEVISLGSKIGIGLKMNDENERTAVAIIASDYLVFETASARKNLKSAIDMLGLFDAVEVVELYAVSKSIEQFQLLPVAPGQLCQMLEKIPLGKIRKEVYEGHFLSEDSTNYVFESQ